MTNNRKETTTNKTPPIHESVNAGRTTKSEQDTHSLKSGNFLTYLDDLIGVILLCIGFMTLGSLLIPSLSGGLLQLWTDFTRKLFGWGNIWIVIVFLASGVWFIVKRHTSKIHKFKHVAGSNFERIDSQSNHKKKINWGQIFALEIAAFASLALLSVVGGTSVNRAGSGLDGGIVGWGLANFLEKILASLGLVGTILTYVILLFVLTWGIIAGTGLWRRGLKTISEIREDTFNAGRGQTTGNVVPASLPTDAQNNQAHAQAQIKDMQPKYPHQVAKKLTQQDADERFDITTYKRDESLPPLDLLVLDQTSKPDEKSINQTAGLIEKTLAEFGIPANVIGYRVGPTVTQFAVEPGFVEKDKVGQNGESARLKIRVAQIASLQRDLALALAAERLRIEAPVPGRPYVGIEVPNTRTMAVRLRAVLESKDFILVNSPLTIALGRDVSGQPVVADLISMPHLLIAGTTGSGKSVCIAAIAICLIMNNSPDSLRLVMIDPKMVELQRFKGTPHLLGDVETDIERISGVLRWVVVEMERRYRLLDTTRSRNIDSYNKKATRRKEEERLPRIVVMIDELSDLMMSAPDQTEHNLVRLAQMARAVGIHLIVATQRPSVEVVTGLIKANFPARIAFNVASSVDSRVILDTTGAENLLGRGDMLFLPPEASSPIRSQGVIVTDQEIQKVIAYWSKKNVTIEKGDQAPWDKLLDEEAILSDRDELIDKAIDLVRGTPRASTSMLQRKLRIGFPRAARLMEELEDLGVVGPAQPGFRDREVILKNE